MAFWYSRAFGLTLFLLLLAPTAGLAQTGKIAGRVTDAATGDPLTGVNIRIDGTTQGTASDIDGYYTILNVRPGEVAVRATYIGFAETIVENVRVNIDQTTRLDIAMREEAVGLDGEVVVVATRPVVEVDVSSSRANVTSEQIDNLPITSVASAVGLQAGAQGLSIRGSSADELSFNLNGLTLRDERSNAPFTNIPLSSVDEIQVITGGFNAEYGNVRSGLINAITKQGSRTRYEVDASIRYSPPTDKQFGGAANDFDSYWIRPFTDPEVAFSGTDSGPWDRATQDQYPRFEGWISVSERLLEDDDPTNDMTPEALYKAFLWQHRKAVEITRPDYIADIGFGGPVPLLRRFGDTRFWASYKEDQSMYLIPLHTDNITQRSGHIKVTSDIARGMVLSVESLFGQTDATSASRSGTPGVFASASGIASDLSSVSFIDSRIFSTDYWAPTRTRDFMLGAKLSHSLDERSFYDVSFTRYASSYDTNPGRLRDTTKVVFFGGVGFDEGPFGFQPQPSNGVDGMRMGVGMSNARDTSRVVVYNVKGNYTRQLNRFLEAKTGFEVNVTDSRANYGSFDAFLRSSNFIASWDRSPTRAAVYLQSKLEINGLVANTGVRLDYFNAGGDWYDYTAFDPALANVARLDTVAQSPTKRIVTVSPRLGVSFPVTTFSKLFFNYGWFRQLPDPSNLFLVSYASETGQVSLVANPNMPLPRTVQYELGYEHSLFDQFLARVTGYYKDSSLDPYAVRTISRSGLVDYTRAVPNAYSDTRGFELSFSRDRGKWIQGFVNYTFMVRTSGHFGLSRLYENASLQRQQEEDESAEQFRPVPQPYARANVLLFSPAQFGPSWGGIHPLGDVRLSLVGRWQAGSYITWTNGGAIRGVQNNVQFRDFSEFELKFSKRLHVRSRQVEFFIDVNNLFNQRRLNLYGSVVDGNDFLAYMRSLHLPEPETPGEYPNIRGNDRPGDYRKPGVAFVPITQTSNRESVSSPLTDRLYFEQATGSYLEFRDGAWAPADPNRVAKVLEDKAYIDMPNQAFLSFLNPRDVYFGFRIRL